MEEPAWHTKGPGPAPGEALWPGQQCRAQQPWASPCEGSAQPRGHSWLQGRAVPTASSPGLDTHLPAHSLWRTAAADGDIKSST